MEIEIWVWRSRHDRFRKWRDIKRRILCDKRAAGCFDEIQVNVQHFFRGVVSKHSVSTHSIIRRQTGRTLS
jgi:hypothetical protein